MRDGLNINPPFIQVPAAGAEAPPVAPKKGTDTESKEAWGPKLKPEEGESLLALQAKHAEREHTKEWENTGLSKVREEAHEVTS